MAIESSSKIKGKKRNIFAELQVFSTSGKEIFHVGEIFVIGKNEEFTEEDKREVYKYLYDKAVKGGTEKYAGFTIFNYIDGIKGF